MKRVSIIGCPGSGKSYFARQLHAATGLPLFHLDKIYHELHLGNDRIENRNLWRSELNKVIKNYSWITDGNYFSTQDLRLPLSDTIIIFDYPLRIVYRRLLKRRWVYRNAKRPDMPDDWQESLNLAFIRSHVLGFRKKYRSQAVPILELLPESIEVVTFKKPKQARQYLASIK